MYNVEIFVDGACSGNPGPGGVGVVMIWNGHEREISRHLGKTTNNRAEISAAIEGLKALKDPTRCSVVLCTDSQLVHGFLARVWKAKVNLDLVIEARELVAKCGEFRCVKTPTHSDDPRFRKADELAKAACFFKPND